MGAPVSASLLWSLCRDQRHRSGLNKVWAGKATMTNLDSDWQLLLTWSTGFLHAAFFNHKMPSWHAKLNQSDEISGCKTSQHSRSTILTLLYLNLNTHSRLERHLVQSERRRWRRWAFIKVCKSKQLMQTLDIPAGTFLQRALRCQPRNSWVKPVRQPSRCEVFLKPGHNSHNSLGVICQAGWPPLHPPLHWLEA